MTNRQPRRRSLQFRFLCIIAAFVGLFSCLMLCFFWVSSTAQMESLLKDKSNLALQFDLALHTYMGETVRPFAQEHMDDDVFIPEVMSTSFAARRVFDTVHQDLPEHIIKFSSHNPRNPQNQAGPEELRVIEYFNNNPEADQWSGRINLNGEEHIGLFSARRVHPTCLECHGDPNDAPASLVARYGDKGGFYHSLGDVIGLATVAMPTKKYQTAARKQAMTAFLVMIAGLVLLLVTVYFLLRKFVGQRLHAIASHFQSTARKRNEHTLSYLKSESHDEIGAVIDSFNTLVDDLSASTTSIDNLHREIAERKQAELELTRHREQLEELVTERTTELRQSEERLELALWGANLGTWDWNVVTGEVTYNEHWTSVLGYAHHEVVPTVEGWKHLLHPEDVSRVMETLQCNLDGESPFYECEFRLRTKAGRWKWILACGKVVESDDHGKAVRHVGVQLDIDGRKQAEAELMRYRDHLEERVTQRTAELRHANASLKREIAERKQAEEALVASRAELAASLGELELVNGDLAQQTVLAQNMAAEARSANAAKSQFLANMSHEIRTPMNSIIGFSEILSQSNLNAEQHDSVEIIKESSHVLLRLIDDILDFSKIEASQLNMEIIDCSLDALLKTVDATMRALAAKKSLDFGIVSGASLPAQIQSDPYRLQQCLLNLLSNAIKFTEHGHVHLKVSLHESEDPPTIHFDVEDTGIGIPADRQQAIFDSFTQADGSTSRKYGGTGLGLTITKHLAELLGGKLSLASEPGQGSVFSLAIPTGIAGGTGPRLDQPVTTPQPVDPDDPHAPLHLAGKVLVAEDVEGNQKLMTWLLNRLGLDVVIAADGLQALEQAKSQSFDLILMDMQMPNMNGYDAAQALKSQGCQTPIVALTANVMKGDDQRCRDAGCDDYLAKPLDHKELSRLLGRYLPVQQDRLQSVPDSVTTPSPTDATPCLNTSDALVAGDEASATESSTVLQWDRLMERMGDEDLIRDIMPTYITDIQAHWAGLARAVEQGNTADIASHAHALKGVSRNLSLNRLCDLTGQMEASAFANTLTPHAHLLGAIQEEVTTLLAVLSQPDWIEQAKNSVCSP